MAYTTLLTSTVTIAFEEFLRRIELNPTRVALASQRYNAIKSTIENVLPGKTIKQIGSFQRKTKIRPVDLSDELDLDMVVFREFFQYAQYGQGVSPSDVFRQIRSALRSNETYRVMEPVIDAPAIVLEYADKFKFEIIPAFADRTGKYRPANAALACYVVPGPYDTWRPADYDYDAAYISETNQLQGVNKHLVPFIRILKAYFRSANIPLKSFHAEILATKIVPSLLIDWESKNLTWGYHHALAGFLSQAATLLGGPISLPGSYSSPMDSGLSTNELSRIASHLSGQGNRAWAICQIKDESKAVQEWSQFIGAPFPIFG